MWHHYSISSRFKTQLSFQFDFKCTNNHAEYEALIIGLEILRQIGAPTIKIVGDSKLVINHLAGEYKFHSEELAPYFMPAKQILDDFDDVIVEHIPKKFNVEVNELAQIATGVTISPGIYSKLVTVHKKLLPSVKRRMLDRKSVV